MKVSEKFPYQCAHSLLLLLLLWQTISISTTSTHSRDQDEFAEHFIMLQQANNEYI